MTKLKLTLGQAVDLMMEGKEVQIGTYRYKISNNCFVNKIIKKEGKWTKTYLCATEILLSKGICHEYKKENNE